MKHPLFFLFSFVVLISSYWTESILLYAVSTAIIFGVCVQRLIGFHKNIYTIKYFSLIAYTTFSWTLIGQILSFFAFCQINGFNQLLNYQLGGKVVEWTFLSLSMAYVCAFCGFFSLFSLLPFVDKCEKEITSFMLRSISFNSRRLQKQFARISYLCGAFLFFLISTGLLGFKGTQVDAAYSSGSQALWYPLVRLSLAILAVLPVFIFKLIEKKWFKHLFLIISFLIGIYVSFTIGRRAFIYQLILCFYSYIWVCLAVDNKLPSIKPRVLLMSGLGIYFIPKLLTFFQYIRTLKLTDLSLSNLYSLYLQFNQNKELLAQIENSQALNYVTRPLLHSVLARLTKIDNLNFTGFVDLHHSFQYSLPTFLVGSKSALYGSKAQLVNAIGIDADWISSPPTMSYLSFGILGLLVYPLLYVGIYYLYSTSVLSILKAKFSSLILIIFFTFWLDNVVQGMPEGTTISYLRAFFIQALIIVSIFIFSIFAKILSRS
ncbi:hypothetical protein [Synechococcus sp. MIT S9507]|uniref:hypothetical protein n=1 Tax=Synechococcus sp. MIT S9507 TaxID=3082544 RepID=UPI0039B6B259